MNNLFLKQLSSISKVVDPKPDCWIGNYPNGDNAMNYCRDCCEKHVQTLKNGFHPKEQEDEEFIPLTDEEKKLVEENEPFVDGGWGSENDTSPICSSCGCIITSIMTDYCIEQELDHYLHNADKINFDDPEEVYILLLAINSAGDKHQDELERLKILLF